MQVLKKPIDEKYNHGFVFNVWNEVLLVFSYFSTFSRMAKEKLCEYISITWKIYYCYKWTYNIALRNSQVDQSRSNFETSFIGFSPWKSHVIIVDDRYFITIDSSCSFEEVDWWRNYVLWRALNWILISHGKVLNGGQFYKN